MQIYVDTTPSTATLKLFTEEYKSRNGTEISRAVNT